MSLPSIAALPDTVSFSATVSPFLYQLELPHLLSLLHRETGPLEWYLSTNPLITALWFSLFLSAGCLAASEINRNYSQVDRLWSLLPAFYIGHFTAFAHLKGFDTQRLDTLATFAALWSMRLTFNYWRKGGYQVGHEDYRWGILKKWIPQPYFFVFNVLFISLYQNLLLFSVSAPAYALLLISSNSEFEPWTFGDLIFSRGLMVTLLIELLADQQQWSFQQAKHHYLATKTVPPGFDKSDLDRGFVVTGLWSWSRHPNFAAEQAIWVLVYQWSCNTTDTIYNWTGIGAALYCALFQGSTWMTEKSSAEKYPEYAEYQRSVARFIPGPKAFKGGVSAVVPEVGKKKN